MEHRFVSNGRVVGYVVMRGLFRSARSDISPSEFVRELGLPEQSPDMLEWLKSWSESCDALSSQLGSEENQH